MTSEPVNIVETEEPRPLPQRLCSEIQLFDLCDLDTCRFRDGRFCTDATLVAKFEAIADEEEKRPEMSSSTTADDDLDDEEWYGESGDDEDDEDGYSVFDAEDREEQDDY